MRQRARRDANESEIIRALERIGCVVYRVSAAGLPDTLTYRHGVWLPIEIKTARGRLTDAQTRTIAQTPFPVVSSVAEALALFGVRM